MIVAKPVVAKSKVSASKKFKTIFAVMLKRVADMQGTADRKISVTLDVDYMCWNAVITPRYPAGGGQWSGHSIYDAEHAIDVLRRAVEKEFFRFAEKNRIDLARQQKQNGLRAEQ